jgi:hypothetical protein
LFEYCTKWNITVNVDKTNIVIFHKGRLKKGYNWVNNNNALEIVNNFNYLGIVMSSSGAFIQATNTLSAKALRAMKSLFTITKSLNVPVKIMFYLYDAYVALILNYGKEMWGFTKAENIERVQRKFCKWLLNVKTSTNSNALYSEVGRYPMYICRYLRVVNYI